MIQPLRTIHRRGFYVLAFTLPVLIGTALVSRHPESPSQRPASASSSSGIKSKNGLIHLWRKRESIEASTSARFDYPEVLVYWTDQSDTAQPDARSALVGRLSATRPLIFAPRSEQGTLIFYSPSMGVVVDTAAVGGTP